MTGTTISHYRIPRPSGFCLGNVSAASEARRLNSLRSSAGTRVAPFRYSRLNEALWFGRTIAMLSGEPPRLLCYDLRVDQ